MRKIEFFLASRAVDNGSYRIIIHILAFIEGKENGKRACAGILREFWK